MFKYSFFVYLHTSTKCRFSAYNLHLQLTTIEIDTFIVNQTKMHSSQKGENIKEIFIGRWGCLTIMNFCSFTIEWNKYIFKNKKKKKKYIENSYSILLFSIFFFGSAANWFLFFFFLFSFIWHCFEFVLAPHASSVKHKILQKVFIYSYVRRK